MFSRGPVLSEAKRDRARHAQRAERSGGLQGGGGGLGTQNKMNLFLLSGHGSESFAAFLNQVILQHEQKNNAAVITAAVTTA